MLCREIIAELLRVKTVLLSFCILSIPITVLWPEHAVSEAKFILKSKGVGAQTDVAAVERHNPRHCTLGQIASFCRTRSVRASLSVHLRIHKYGWLLYRTSGLCIVCQQYLNRKMGGGGIEIFRITLQQWWSSSFSTDQIMKRPYLISSLLFSLSLLLLIINLF